MIILRRLTLLLMLIPSLGYAEGQPHHKRDANISPVEALSPELRNLLSQEMLAIQKGMISIIPAYVSGNWQDIETTAENIKNSYLLKQQLSNSQRHELHSLLPDEFIRQDQEFHYRAGMLQHAAKNRKPELVNFYFSKMMESCVSCHTAFAAHKFPDLAVTKKQPHKH